MIHMMMMMMINDNAHYHLHPDDNNLLSSSSSCWQQAGDYRPSRPAAGPGAQRHAEGVGTDMAQTLCGRPWL